MATPKFPQRRYVSLADGATYVDCSERTLRRQIAAGHLKAYRLGRLIRLDLNEIEAAMRPVPAAEGGDAA